MDDNGELQVKWLLCSPAMETLLENASCKCKTGCKNRRCVCKKADLTCTELCGCIGCENRPVEQNPEDDDDVYRDIESDDSDFE